MFGVMEGGSSEVQESEDLVGQRRSQCQSSLRGEFVALVTTEPEMACPWCLPWEQHWTEQGHSH